MAKFFFCVFMDKDKVEVYNLAKKEKKTSLVSKRIYFIAFGEIFLVGHGG